MPSLPSNMLKRLDIHHFYISRALGQEANLMPQRTNPPLLFLLPLRKEVGVALPVGAEKWTRHRSLVGEQQIKRYSLA